MSDSKYQYYTEAVAPQQIVEEQPQYNYPPMPQLRGEKADLLDKIRPEVIIDTVRHRLMGEDLIDGTWTKVKSLQHRSLTEEGAWDIANLMLTASSQNVAISMLRDDEIRLRSLEITKTAHLMMNKNWKAYGIKGTDQIAFVHQIVFTNTFITLKQAQNGGGRGLIMGTTSESRLVSSEDKHKGMASKLWDGIRNR